MGVRCTEKREVGQRGYNKLKGATSYSPRLAVVISGDGDDESQKSGGKEFFFGCGRCVSGSVVVIR